MTRSSPNWDSLYQIAAGQDGYFTAAQAQLAGYSLQLLRHHLRRGRIRRERRGIYRLVHYPHTDDEDMVVLWLWSEQAGVLSHSTALACYQLSDILPVRYHMTLPAVWRERRLKAPAGLMLHFADIPAPERTWWGCLPITTPARTLRDCALDYLSRPGRASPGGRPAPWPVLAL